MTAKDELDAEMTLIQDRDLGREQRVLTLRMRGEWLGNGLARE